jgi:L-seryl-tRNA(Ser) seleniumtransferase
MPKTASPLRAIPSVERILSSDSFAGLVRDFGRERTKSAVVDHLSQIRVSREAYHEADAIHEVKRFLTSATTSTLRRLINASGVIIHTNLGRSPIDPSIWSAAQEVVAGYSNLEFDVDRGERGARDTHLESLCSALFGCEAAILTNNNAAATLLVLASIAAKKEVIVSRGELVEIGGAFRVPDVIQQGGAKLREVGTTNRTRASDYAGAISKKSAAILKVHRSNFDIVGFTETPRVEELIEVAHAKKIPMLYDEGSGRVVDLAKYGFASAPTIRELIATGVDVVTCSTDKLIGATQGGLILGKREIVDRCRRHPLMRALRAGKESYAVVAETLRAFATGKHEERIAIYRMLSMSIEELRARASKLSANIVESQCALGGGTTPTETIPSIAIAVEGNASQLYETFLARGIVGRVQNDIFTIEVRTLLDEDLDEVATALR